MNEQIDNCDAESGEANAGRTSFRVTARRTVYSMIKILIITYIVWLVVLYFSQNSMLFPAKMAMAVPPVMPYPDAHVLTVDIPEGEVVAWLIRPEAVDAQKKLPVVIFFHGNAEIIDYPQGIVEAYHRMGYAILLPEYRGYGRSAGSPSQKAIVKDVTQFYDQLVTLDNIDTSKIIFHGRSLGGAVAAQLAAKRKPVAMILQSTFKSVSSMAWQYGAPPIIVANPFRTDRVLAKADWPVLIFHGTYDRIIPVAHGKALKDITPNNLATFIQYPTNHNDFPGSNDAYKQYLNDIKSFLDANLSSQ